MATMTIKDHGSNAPQVVHVADGPQVSRLTYATKANVQQC